VPSTALEPRPVLVAVGSEAKDLRLVHAAFRVAKQQARPWVAVHIHVADWEAREEAEQARSWLREAADLGARTDWVKAPTLAGGLLEAARNWQPSTLLLGQGRLQGLFGGLERTRTLDLLKRSLDSQVLVLPLDSPDPRHRALPPLLDLVGLVLALLVFLGVTTLAAAALHPILGAHAVQAAFALALVFIIHRFGILFAVPATGLAIVIYEVFFRGGPRPLGPRDWPGLGAFIGAVTLAQVFMALVDRIKLETRAIHRLEAETALLMLLGRALARCTSREEVAEVLAERSGGLLKARAWLLGSDGEGILPPGGEDPPAAPPGGAPEEDPLEPVFEGAISYISLGGGEGRLLLKREDGNPFPPEEWGLLQAFAGLVSVALERIRWIETANREKVDKETERMRNTLLGAVSHDLRTPLAAIQGAATSLLLPEHQLPEAARLDLLVMIREESERLARFLGDLLDLTRLQSGALRANKEWQPLDEVVGAAIGRMETRLGALAIRVDLPADLPLAHLDGSLMEQVLLNLMGNALRHAPGSAMVLSAWAGAGSLELAVTDDGPGIPRAYQNKVFDKFFRMPGLTRDGGVGLGLAICEAIVKAHGGRIWVEDRPSGGACFRITLPLEGQPPSLFEVERESASPEPPS